MVLARLYTLTVELEVVNKEKERDVSLFMKDIESERHGVDSKKDKAVIVGLQRQRSSTVHG